MASNCPRSRNPNTTKTKQVKWEESGTASEKEKEKEEGDAVTQLLQEANKMLKSLTKDEEKVKSGASDHNNATLEALQQQLNEAEPDVEGRGSGVDRLRGYTPSETLEGGGDLRQPLRRSGYVGFW